MYGIKYISAIEAAERWHLSRRRVVALCGGGRIIGAQKAVKGVCHAKSRGILDNPRKCKETVRRPC